jgi:exosortase
LALLAAVLWAYWTTFVDMAGTWAHEPEYSHGFLVPVFAAVLLWFRRDELKVASFQPSWWGLVLIALGLVMRAVGFAVSVEWFEQLSLLPFLAGLVLLVGGWPAFRWAWPAVAFLIFMVPLPFRLKIALAAPLQRIATVVTTYVMQTLGMPALSEGNVVIINDVRIGVVEACSGLSMLVVFFALATAVAILIKRPLLDRIIIFLSAIPIAIVSNVIRISVTGVLHVWAGKEIADLVFHDLAGWLMMPLALGIMWLELQLLSWLLIEPQVPTRPVRVNPPPGGVRKQTAPAPAR